MTPSLPPCPRQFLPAVASLGRPLAPEERLALSHLTAAGIAKINADACRNVPFADTLSDLTAVFTRVQQRKEQMAAREGEWGPRLAGLTQGRTTRPLGSLAVDFLLELTASPQRAPLLQRELQRQLQRGDALDDVLEDVVSGTIGHQVQCIAHRLRKKGKKVTVTTLVRTMRPVSSCVLAEPSQCNGVLRVGLSPLVSWFAEEPCLDAGSVLAWPIPVSCPTTVGAVTPLRRSPSVSTSDSSCGLSGSPLSLGSDPDFQTPDSPLTAPRDEFRAATRPRRTVTFQVPDPEASTPVEAPAP